MKLSILTNTPSPYQVEFFRALAVEPDVDLTVLFMRAAHRGRTPLADGPVGFRYRLLRAVGPAAWRDELRLHRAAVHAAWKGAQDFYVLSGLYTSLTFVASALVLRRRGRRWGVWLERPRPEAFRPGWGGRRAARIPGVRRLRTALLRRLVRGSDAVFAVGSKAAGAYAALGAAPEKVHVLPYLCDVERFRGRDPARVRAVRAEHGLGEGFVFLFSGQLVPRKGVDVLLRAFGRLLESTDHARLLILGDGPLRRALDDSLASRVRAAVRFAGHVDQSRMPDHFAAADAFVFPSRYDGWGVVVNEACAAGLPLIVSRQTGAAHDLVREGENGFRIDAEAHDEMARRMLQLVEDPGAARRMGERSREIATAFTPARGAALMRRVAMGEATADDAS